MGIDYGAKHAFYRHLLINGSRTKAVTHTFRIWNEKVFPMTKLHESDSEAAVDSEDDHVECQRRARDGAQPVHNILAAIEDSSDDNSFSPGARNGGDDAAQPNRKGKGVDHNATFMMENLSISIAPTRPATPVSDFDDTDSDAHGSRKAVHQGDNLLGEDFQVNPFNVAHADLRDILDKTLPPQDSTLPHSLSRAPFRRPTIVSACQAQVFNSTAASSAAASLSVAPAVPAVVVPAPPAVSASAQPTVVVPAPCRTSNQGKPAAGTSEVGNGQAAGPSNGAAPVHGGKAGKKSWGA